MTTPHLVTNLTFATAAALQEGINETLAGIAKLNRSFSSFDTARANGAGNAVFEVDNTLGPAGGTLNIVGVDVGRGTDFWNAFASAHDVLNSGDILGNLAKIDQGAPPA